MILMLRVIISIFIKTFPYIKARTYLKKGQDFGKGQHLQPTEVLRFNIL